MANFICEMNDIEDAAVWIERAESLAQLLMEEINELQCAAMYDENSIDFQIRAACAVRRSMIFDALSVSLFNLVQDARKNLDRVIDAAESVEKYKKKGA